MSNQKSVQNYFFMTLGAPGSGKSYVCDWLTPKFKALRLRSDDLRVAMLGTLRPEFHREPYSSMINGAMEYAAKQALAQNHSVVFDTNTSTTTRRQELCELAKSFSALPVTVWVQTPLEVARERALDRDRLEAENGEEVNVDYVDEMSLKIEPPSQYELVIILNGQETAEGQQISFEEQLKIMKQG